MMDFSLAAPFVFFLSQRRNYRDSIISKAEVFCGPDTEDEKIGNKYRCVKTPAQPFDAASFLNEKGLSLRPDLILVKADATGRTFPRNLGAFKCPKVLLVGVTHFLSQPIRKVIEYAKSEPFDFIIMDVTRHHAHWFQKAGFKNVHWLPALEYNPLIRPVKKNPRYPLTFAGQTGAHHPFRRAILDRLKADGLPLEILHGPQSQAADIYSDSLTTLNITLNGDINMRFFEGLAAGGFLLCDRLPEWSGLDRLFKAGEDFDLFGSYGELAEKLKFYFSKPDLVYRIKKFGQERLVKFHSPEVKRKEFYDLVFNGVENPLYALEDPGRTMVLISNKPDMEMLPAYEFFQELHRNRSRLVFYCAASEAERVRRFVDLPRVDCRTHAELTDLEKVNDGNFPEEWILHIGNGVDPSDLENLLTKSQAQFIFAPRAESEAFLNWGFTQKELGVFELTRPVLGIVRRARNLEPNAARPLLSECVDMCINDAEALAVADLCDTLEIQDLRRDALLRAVFLNRDCVSALIQLADLSIEADLLVDAAVLLSEANRAEPLPEVISPVFAELMDKVSKTPAILEYNQLLGKEEAPPPVSTRKILVVTNLFPPQELGGYGRKIWEFSNGLIKRGHCLKILTGDANYLQKTPDLGEPDLEPLVERSLLLQGEWKHGKTQQLGDLNFLRRTAQANREKVLAAVSIFKPDFVLLGNFDFLGVDILRALIAEKIPVLHSLGNQTPGYHPQESIESPLYSIAPASDWLGKNLLQQGYKVSKLSTVYPGARVDRFFKQFLPDIRRLRIAFAGLVMPYKGAHVLMGALNILKESGIEFEADFAGDSTDVGYIQKLKDFAQTNGMASKVRFNGFLDRQGLANLFARCNVLVFPTQVPEAFGISQVEAMASGLIVITSGTGGTQEVIRHGIDGLVFEMGNAVSLAQSLATLATNKELRDRLQINSQKRALQFSVTKSVVRIESIAGDLISLKNGEKLPEKQVFDESHLISKPANLLITDLSQPLTEAMGKFNEGRLSDAEDICREILGKDERCAGAWHLMGKMAVLQGDWETAGEFASVACELDSQNADFVRELAEVFLRKKELEPAEQQVRRALEMSPDSPEGLVLLGRILAEKDDKSASLEAFQDALRLRKDYAEGFSHYATALQKFARGKDAISQIRKACALEPDSVEFQTNLAILLEQNARYVDALAAYGKAARMNPNVGFVWFRQGKLLNGLKRYAESIPALEKAISLPGQLGDYYYEYGLALHMSKRFQEALVHYEKALSMGYNTAALQCNRGVIYKDLRKGGDAIMAFHAAVTMDPSNVSYLNNLGAAALELGLNSEALDCFEQAVEKNPKLPTARNNIGNLLKDRARGMDALPQYRKSMELNPDDRDAPSNYLLCHMYIPDMDPKLVFEEHKKWGISTTKKFPPAFKFKPREAGAKIRVGFLSADLCHHPVAHFIEPIFRGYDHERFEFVAYGDQRKSDEFSARFAKQVDLWRETSSYDDRALAKLIHEDRVDILFELAGHTAYNRLGVFALKPAPVQVSYLGYPGTTGLPTIDFRITDAFADPQGTTEHLHTEKLIRVPECAWCFEPDASAPEIEPLPALKNGFVTFGCFNNMAKLNPALFETWAEILLRVPGSHLRLKARTLTDDGVRKELKSYFTERGIEEDRLDFFGHTKKIADHLNHYHSVDIALDSFPYHGTTTTCEAMWMGCPVVTRAGKTHVSRVGVSLLTAVGLQEFITDTREAYIEKAVALASQTDQLQELRAGMRERMRQSVLMDEKRFVQGFEKALIEMATLGGLMRS